MNDETKQSIAEAVEKTVEAAEDAVRRPLMMRLARLGFYTKGFLFLVIGVFALLLVFGYDEGRLTDASGALAAVSRRPFGTIFLIVFVGGAVGHGAWNILRGAADIDGAGGGWIGATRRIIPIGIGIFYVGLAVSAAEIIVAARAPAGSGVEETLVSLLLRVPLGGVLIVLIGLGVIVAGMHECYSGLSGKFRENYRLWEINGVHLSLIGVLGVLSFSARAILMLLIGYFFIMAAFKGSGRISIGLDAALLAILKSSYGRIFVLLTAIGLICHGVLAFYEARYRKIC